MDHKDIQQSIVLALPELLDRHAGGNLKIAVIDIFNIFWIKSKQIGFFIADNASNLDTSMREMEDWGVDEQKQ
jgi:hypothetical protein